MNSLNKISRDAIVTENSYIYIYVLVNNEVTNYGYARQPMPYAYARLRVLIVSSIIGLIDQRKMHIILWASVSTTCKAAYKPLRIL